ncbi:MAG: Uma2 family endonuclease [Myxococcota bacterium]
MTAEPIDKKPARRRFTVEEYYLLAEAGILSRDDRVELVDGEIIEMAPIGSQHAAHVSKLNMLFAQNLSRNALVQIQNPVRLSRFSEPEPDVALLRPRDDYYASAHPGPDDVFLVVEVADTSLEYDRSTKVPLYAEHGIPSVWLLDLQDQAVECYEHPESGVYERVHILSGDDEVTLDSLGLSFEASDLFV